MWQPSKAKAVQRGVDGDEMLHSFFSLCVEAEKLLCLPRPCKLQGLRLPEVREGLGPRLAVVCLTPLACYHRCTASLGETVTGNLFQPWPKVRLALGHHICSG